MYVYIPSDPSLFTVGFYDPQGNWISESDYEDREQAASRVAYLNGSYMGITINDIKAAVKEAFTDEKSGN